MKHIITKIVCKTITAFQLELIELVCYIHKN